MNKPHIIPSDDNSRIIAQMFADEIHQALERKRKKHNPTAQELIDQLTREADR